MWSRNDFGLANFKLPMRNKFLLLLLICCSGVFAQNPSFVWAKRILNVGSFKPDAGHDIVADANKNVYVTGQFTDTLYVANDTLMAPVAMAEDVFVMKAKPNGTPLWAIPFSSTNSDNSTQIRVSPSGDKIFVAGKMAGSPATFGNSFSGVITKTYSGWSDFVACLDTSGHLLWVNMVANVNGSYAPAIALDANANIYMAGCFYDNSSISFMATNGNFTSPQSGNFSGMYLIKMDAAGNLQQHIVEKAGAGAYPYYAPYGMDYSAAANSIYITGYFFDSCYVGSTVAARSYGQTDVFLSSYSTSLTPNWLRSFGGNDLSSVSDCGMDVSADAEGNAILIGVFVDTCIFGSTTLTDATSGNGEGFIAEISSSGNSVWAKQFHNPSAYSTFLLDVEVGRDASIYLSGAMHMPGKYVNTNLTGLNTNNFDFFVMKTDSLGNFDWFESGGGGFNDYGYGMCISGNNDIYITGALGETSSWTFDTIQGFAANGAGNYYDICYAKLNDPQVTIGVNEWNPLAETVSVFPNPSNGNFKVETDFPARIIISDLRGRCVYDEQTLTGEICLGEIAEGCYVLTAIAGEQVSQVKIVIKR